MFVDDNIYIYIYIVNFIVIAMKWIDKMKENGFKQTKERSRRYSTQTITDPDYPMT